jgi:hypothetical protein
MFGCVPTVIEYALPVAIDVANVNAPLELTERASPPLFSSTRPLEASPVTVPPTVNDVGAGGVGVVFPPPLLPPYPPPPPPQAARMSSERKAVLPFRAAVERME